LIDFMLNDKGNFSQRGQLQRPDHADMRYKCRTYARLLQFIKVTCKLSCCEKRYYFTNSTVMATICEILHHILMLYIIIFF
jgi:hypothetical protein